MKKILLFTILILIAAFRGSFAQEFNTDQQYNQAMENAKQAFDAQQYSEAVMFYREASSIKPEALLPKYKVEDIRTIYIEKELDSIVTIAEEAKRISRKKKKEIEAKKVVIAEQAKEEATRKMNEDADQVVEELRALTVNVIDIEEEIGNQELGNTLTIDEITGDKELLIAKVAAKEQDAIKGGASTVAKTALLLEKRDVPILKENLEVTEPKLEVKKEDKPTPVVKVVSAPAKPKALSAEEKKIWIEKEKTRLATVYPNKKTIEEIDKPGKHITRVILNIDNKVTVYLKVRHSWGATYFFMDEVGQELKSINEHYFNLMTNLKTYERG